jgi:WhiB family redox-sensing transcriptional regulator
MADLEIGQRWVDTRTGDAWRVYSFGPQRIVCERISGQAAGKLVAFSEKSFTGERPAMRPADGVPRQARRELDWTWAERAACLGADVKDFYPFVGAGSSNAAEPALRVCRSCPVREECLEMALRNNERWGIWGGKTADERIQMLRQRSAEHGPGDQGTTHAAAIEREGINQ